MTIQTKTCQAVYIADGITTEFPVSFYFFNKEIAVYLNFSDIPLRQGTDYEVENLEKYGGGTVKFTDAPKAGDIITITRDVELKQLITFLEGEKFPAQDFEHALDRLTMGLQQIQECISRAVLVPHGTNIEAKDIFHCLEMLNQYWEIILDIPLYITDITNTKTDVVEAKNENLVTSKGVYNYAYNRETINEKFDSLAKKINNTAINITPATAPLSEDNENYPYSYNIAINGVTENHCPVVMFNQTDALSGNFAPYAKAYNGGITLYLKENTDYNTTIPLILLL